MEKLATEIIIPQIDKRFDSVAIVKWYKKPGEYVEAGEPLIEVETSKVCVIIEADASGILIKTLKGAGDVVPANTVIGYIGAAGEEIRKDISCLKGHEKPGQ